jgi:hypothetical protein
MAQYAPYIIIGAALIGAVLVGIVMFRQFNINTRLNVTEAA